MNDSRKHASGGHQYYVNVTHRHTYYLALQAPSQKAACPQTSQIKMHFSDLLLFCKRDKPPHSSKNQISPENTTENDTMATHYESPNYLDIILMIRRFNTNCRSTNKLAQWIVYESDKDETRECRELESTGYSQTQKDIDILIGSLLLVRRALAERKSPREKDTQQMREAYAKVLKATSVTTSEPTPKPSSKPSSGSPRTAVSRTQHENAVAGPSTPKAKHEATPANPPFDPTASKHNDKKFRPLTASTKAIHTSTVYIPKPKATPARESKPSNLPVRTYIPTRLDPSIPKTPLKIYIPEGTPEYLLTLRRVPRLREREKRL